MTSVRVYLHNETEYFLRLVDAPQPHGDWLTRPPDEIPPRSIAMMGSDSDFAQGTEARATYAFGNDPNQTVYVHWNNPFSGGNSYHTNTDDGHYAFWTATGHSDSTVHFTVRDAGAVTTDFLPSRDGFRFANSWGDVPYSLPPLRGSVVDLKWGNADGGLCGGMVFAALDYFLAGKQITQRTMPPPGEEDPYFLYLVDRLFATFDPASVSLMLNLMLPTMPDGDEAILNEVGLVTCRAAVMAHQEWPIIRADLDAGRPSPMFVQTIKSLNPGDLGHCHQVLAYGYEAHGHTVTLHVYDPNQPPTSTDPGVEDRVFLTFDDGDISGRIVVQHNVDVFEDKDLPTDPDVRRPIYSFARMNYTPAPPGDATPDRIPGYVVENRRASLVTHEPVLVASSVTETGQRSFDIWPDCGTQILNYSLLRQDWQVVVEATPIGYYNPVLSWRIGSASISPGGETWDLPGTQVSQPVPSTPDDLALRRERSENRTVEVQALLEGNRLTVTTRGGDGTFTLPIIVTCGESDDEYNTEDFSTSVEVAGWREDVPGLSANIGACFRRYIDRHRDGLPDLNDLMRSQLGRPGNPLLDPDPTYAVMTASIGREDPMLVDVQAALSSLPNITDLITSAQGAVEKAKIPDVHELTAEELAAKLQKQLQDEIQSGFHLDH